MGVFFCTLFCLRSVELRGALVTWDGQKKTTGMGAKQAKAEKNPNQMPSERKTSRGKKKIKVVFC